MKSIFNVCEQPQGIAISYVDYVFDPDYSLRGYSKLLRRKKQEFVNIDQIISIARNFKPEIIHFHTTPRELILRKFFDPSARYLFTDHLLRLGDKDLSPLKNFVLSVLFRKFYSGFEIICVSKKIEASLLKNKIAPAGKIRVIENAVDTSFFRRTQALEKISGLRAIYVSRIDTVKGHEDLIRAWSTLTSLQNKHLSIVGPDLLQGKMQRLADELGCADSITFTGPMANPKDLLNQSNLAVFPSYKEGLPLSLLEKMAMELPLVVSDIPELTSVIEAGKEGLVYPVGNIQQLASCMQQLADEPLLRLRYGKQARQKVESHFNRQEAQKQLEEVYQSLIRN